MKIAVTLANGKTHDLLGISDADEWVRSFGVRGTSLLGDWVEVVPDPSSRWRAPGGPERACGQRDVRRQQGAGEGNEAAHGSVAWLG